MYMEVILWYDMEPTVYVGYGWPKYAGKRPKNVVIFYALNKDTCCTVMWDNVCLFEEKNVRRRWRDFYSCLKQHNNLDSLLQGIILSCLHYFLLL